MTDKPPSPQKLPRPQVSRREFLRLTGGVAAGGLLVLLLKPSPVYAIGARPPGAMPELLLSSSCIHCSRCVAVCDQNAIQLDENGLPHIRGLDGWCDFCMKCGEACPTGALTPVDPQTAKIATARIDKDRCIAWDWNACGLCYERCLELQQAIWRDDDLHPFVDENKCNGCGACVMVCPRSAVPEMHKKYGKAISLV